MTNSNLAWVAVGFCLAAGGCAPSSQVTFANNCPPLGKMGTGEGRIGLVACAPVEEAASSSRRVFVALVNYSGRPLYVRGRLDMEDGIELRRLYESGGSERIPKDGYLWEQVDIPRLESLPLPVGGIYGRMIDLACPAPDFESADSDRVCHPIATFGPPGTYRIEVLYDGWICLDEPCDKENSLPTAEYEQIVELVVRPR